MSFLIQPFHRAMAEEATQTEPLQEESLVASDVQIQEENLAKEQVQEISGENFSNHELTQSGQNSEIPVQELLGVDGLPQNATYAIVSETAETGDVVTTASTSSLNTQADSSVGVPTEYTGTETTDTEELDVANKMTGRESSNQPEISPETSSSTEDNTENTDAEMLPPLVEQTGIVTTIATSTQISGQTDVVVAQNLVTEDNFYQFSRQSCVAIGDGTYHCTVAASTGIDTRAVVYAELGANANMEIFLRTSKGEIKQLTDNTYDDTSPHYDAEAKKVVWQRLIDDRYQIVLYDIEKEKETQLTFSRTNNMEPKVSAEGIVWQAWDNNDWEIMYFDGTYTDQITDNFSQDLVPTINDGYILWTVLGETEQEAKVYSLASGETVSISGYEGGMITNPRFVLVYDTLYENGDIVTQGFDPATGLSAPIAAKPAPQPVNIPETDATGEIRALIQVKSAQKDKQAIDGGTGPVSTSTPTTTTSSIAGATLDLSQGAVTQDIASSTTGSKTLSDNDSTFELTDFDLVLVSPQSTSSVQSSTDTNTGE
ncbi:hypothetical protein GW937_00670 [Candidatus Kaiserbacteria bacterium]|nr:hypothetical protein [Candidatus Kaiserbacteria bacterium]